MPVRGLSRWGRKATGAVMGMTLLLAAASCGGSAQGTPSGSPSSSASSSGPVALMLPDDGITLSQSTPLNKWTSFGSSLKKALTAQGFDDDEITSVKSKTLEDQTRAVEDFTKENKDTKNSKATLVLAPVAQPDDATRQYGDYINQSLSVGKDTEGTENTSLTDAKTSSASASSDDARRLRTSLVKAQKAGISVVLVANTIEGYAPDAYVQMSSLREIAHTQATLLANKLDLPHATKANPKHIEILLPSSDATTDKEVFAGIWQVLGPYFKSGAVVSPSGALDSSSTEDSWKSLVIKATDRSAISTEFTKRIGFDDDNGLHPSLDGVLAMNDMMAAAVTDALSDMKYEGSAADINPQITIGGIVDNLAGNKDLKKGKVPDPGKTDSATGDESEADTETQNAKDDPAWPIVTGYGAYLSNITNVVNGRQWSTGLEDRNQYATDTATICKTLANGDKLSSTSSLKLSTTLMDDVKVPTVHESIRSVSASNLKKTLIDPGYIRPADAGL
ncbi:substrate-binding domain-containing protein [Bifidobacterium sp. SMB2]|uniref:Substrate-binding domain-containing protein n=1 Tax=Bifidobacterium saimiriisciurei TaxID=2661627 RepID=A0ABX0CAX3_9BIFI|nr:MULTISPECIES: substrate-binding domain-containing protein [Bifidobacterium]NEG96799.1 substrate-binding domain-containing protein [Bifidobacterium sp. SMB2]NEH12268.1 substrate-binding domain-containing protein [Bifidobacterium saimiriisciurei]